MASSFDNPFWRFQASHLAFPFRSNSAGHSVKRRTDTFTELLVILCFYSVQRSVLLFSNMTAQYQYLCLQLQTVCRVHRSLLVPHHLAWFSASSRLWPPCQNQPKTKRHSAFANFRQVYLLQENLKKTGSFQSEMNYYCSGSTRIILILICGYFLWSLPVTRTMHLHIWYREQNKILNI